MKKLLMVLALATLCCATTLAQAYDYMPIDPSNPNSDHWYVSPTDPDVEWHTYSGEPDFGFTTHHMVQYVSGEEVHHGVWLMSVDDDGNVWVHAISQDGGENYFFADPDFPLVNAPLYVGLVWTWEMEGAGTAELECLAEEDIEVCGETYHAFHVRRTEHLFGSDWVGHEWYSDGFGVVKMIWADDEYVLQCPVPVEQQSWSDVKGQYR